MSTPAAAGSVKRFAEAAADDRAEVARELASLGIQHLVLSTSGGGTFAAFLARERRRR